MAGQPVDLKDDNFAATVASGVTLVNFWADWCGPCRRLAPTIEALAETYRDRAIVCKVNVDAAADLARRYGIRGIPAVLVFHEGREVERLVGLQPASAYARALDALAEDADAEAGTDG